LPTFNPQNQKHGDDSEKGTDCIKDNERERIVIWNEKNVKDCGCRKISNEQTAGIGKDGACVEEEQTKDC